MTYTKPFKDLNKNDAHIAGGKGASLGEMFSSSIPVPDGFVVLADTFEEFISKSSLVQEIDAILDGVDHKTVHTVDAASLKIQKLIKHASMPEDIEKDILSAFTVLNSEFVAVRSSATAEDGADNAWAGQLDSYLNTKKDSLLEKVQHCWASLFTPRAIFYRFEKGLHATKISVAVVVQKMVNSEISGIAFSVHPITEDRNQLLIEAGFGLGEAIVSGSVTPDSYVVEKEPKRILNVNVSNQIKALYRKKGGGNEWVDLDTIKTSSQALTEGQILELSDIIMAIENHYGFPCDIEWAYENGKFYIVQSRPITTLSTRVDSEKIEFEKVYTRDTTLIIQQAWCVALEDHQKELMMKEYDNKTLVLHYLNDGVIEVWENLKWTQDLMDKILEKNRESESIFNENTKKHLKQVAFLKPYWEQGFVDDISELIRIVDVVFETMAFFDWMYYPAVDDRTPTSIRDQALKMRNEDVYFDKTDKFFRKSLTTIYPHLEGYEQGILRNEISNPPALEVLRERKKHFIIVGEHEDFSGTIREYQSKHPDFHFNIEVPPADNSTLIGQIGNKGYVKGKVRIMKRKEQIGDAEEGDVIVSTMTTPDFVPAMKKAAAIITDEGGITCHAAIVARELNKPCVIGTKFATQVLKDGDIVEVDADNGFVKKLN